VNAPLEFFATDEAVAVLEAQLETATGLERVHALVAVAWQMRQRDTRRALALAEEAEVGLRGATSSDDAAIALSASDQATLQARLQLIRGEAHWLFGELDAAKALAERALHHFKVLGEASAVALGCADAYWLQAWLAQDQGDGALRDAALVAMTIAVAVIDPVRVTVAQAALARFAVFRDVDSAKAQWGEILALDCATIHPAAACWVEDFWGLVAGLSSDHVHCIRHWSKAYPLALASGQLLRAMILATNTGDSFNSLNDYHAALEWMQRGLDLSRSSSWLGRMGGELMETANTLRLLQRLDAAAQMLNEALTLMAPLAASRNYAFALHYQGDLELDRRHYASALDSFRLLEQRALALDAVDLLSEARRGQAKALFELGQPEPALQAALSAQVVAKADAYRQIKALRVIAEIHTQYPLPPPLGMQATSASLHYLQQALDAAATIENFTVPGELLEALAQAYADVGEHAKAYELAKQANVAREKIHSTEAANRASAMQVSHETEKARAEGEHQRQLARAQAERANTLEQANATLEQLGAIGRDITGNLDPKAIFAALDTHVHTLLDATTFMVYRLEADGTTLRMAFGVEAGRALTPVQFRLDDAISLTARCASDRQEFVREVEPGHGNTLAGTLETLSMMFAPLLVGDRLLGVMTIQSVKPHAYAEREVAIFRTLCAYGAIALANAEAQAQLVQAEKMASLGQLVANVAHEINTPIGAVKSSGASIADSLKEALAELPKLGRTLSLEDEQRFVALISRAYAPASVLSPREERAARRELSAQLTAAGLEDCERKARLLLQLGAHDDWQEHLALLSHPDYDFIHTTAQSLAAIINSTSNIHVAVERVSKMVLALKGFAQAEQPGERVAVDLRQALDAVLAVYADPLKQGVELTLDCESIGTVQAIPDDVKQLWTHLIHNALQAMEYKGKLGIGIQAGTLDGQTAAVLSVCDTGHGIPADIRPKVFDAFFTTRRTGEGSGLGLYLVQKMVDKHRGRITLQTEPGEGTTFTVHLPLLAVAN
jgi:signal transduction histidine kinase